MMEKRLGKLHSSLFLALCCISALCLGACGKDDKEPVEPPMLQVGNSRIEANAQGITQSFNVTSNCDWSVSGYPSWVTVSPSQGSGNAAVNVTVSENTDTKERSCTLNVKSTTGSIGQTVTVTQKGSEVKLSTDISSATIGAKEGDEVEIAVFANTQWTLSGLPSWLKSSAPSGNTDKVIKLTALSDNVSATERTATLTIRAGGKSITVNVRQLAMLAKVTVVPANVIALYYQTCFEFDVTGNISTFQFEIISESEINRMTDKQIIRELEKNDKLVYNDEYIISSRTLDEKTTYYICTIAYDSEENRGELVKTRVQTPAYKDADNDAWVRTTPYFNASYVNFEFTKQGLCHKYHAIFGANYNEGILGRGGAFYAFQINYYLKHGKKHWFGEKNKLTIYTNYPNDHTFSEYNYNYPTYPYGVMYAWGVFEDGTLSSDCVGGDFEHYSTSSPAADIRATKEFEPAISFIIRRSDMLKELRNKQ